jgi:hypothetical protein
MTRREFLTEKDFNSQTLDVQVNLTFEVWELPTHPNEDSMIINLGGGRYKTNDELAKLNVELLNDFPRFKLILRKLLTKSKSKNFSNDLEIKLSIISEIREEVLNDIV